MLLPGLVGSGPLWVRGCREVEEVHRSASGWRWPGEPGVGKLAIVRAVHQRHNPSGRLHAVDAAGEETPDRRADLRRELLHEADTLVIRHVDRLSAPAAAVRWRRCCRRPSRPASTAPCGFVVTLSSAGENVAANKDLSKSCDCCR